jgi:hypothetical protein
MPAKHRRIFAAFACAVAAAIGTISLIAQEPHAKPAIRGLVSMGAYKFVGAGGEPVNTLEPLEPEADSTIGNGNVIDKAMAEVRG